MSNQNLKKISFESVEKIASILNNSRAIGLRFYKKWGIKPKNFESAVTNTSLHGGIHSKINSIKNMSILPTDTVLDVGPEIGLETFILAEVSKKVIVIDADNENLKLLKAISNFYITASGIKSVKKLRFVHTGLETDPKSIVKEKMFYMITKKLYKHSLPTYYNLTTFKNLDTIKLDIDKIFVHKIMASLSRSSLFSPKKILLNSLVTLIKKLKPGGVISWTEPEFIFKDKKITKSVIQKNIKCMTVYKKYMILPGENYIQVLIKK